MLISFAILFLFPKMDVPTLGERGSISGSRRLVSGLWISQATRKESNHFWFADHTELRGYEAKDRGRLVCSAQGTDNEAMVTESVCSQCSAPMTCEPEHGCWCADFPHVLPVPDETTNGCLCPKCLTKRLELYVIPPVSRVERHFPTRAGEPARVLLINPARDASVPSLDFLKLSTFLRNRGYKSVVKIGVPKKATVEPYAVVLTSVFSWEIPALRRALTGVRRLWPRVRTILSSVLPRKLGDKVQSELGVSVLDEASEACLMKRFPTMDWHLNGTHLSLSRRKGFVPESVATVRRR